MTDFSSNTSLPRGLRDNNVGNIRPNPAYTWYGAKGVENNYVIFDDVEHGIRAMAKDLRSKIKRGLNTIASYIPVYAPPSDNNNTEGYIQRVEKLSGISRSSILTADYPTLSKLVKAHINVEIGEHYAALVTDQMIKDGVTMALT